MTRDRRARGWLEEYASSYDIWRGNLDKFQNDWQ